VSEQPSRGRRDTLHAAEDEFPSYRWLIIGQMILQQQMGPFMFSSLGVLLPAMQHELGFGVIETGWLGSARTVGNLLVFPASIFLVRFRPIRMFNGFALLLAASLFISGSAQSFWFVLLGMMLYSFGMSFGQIPANMVRQQWIPPREMATVAGGALALGTIFQSLGLAVVPLILVAVGGWRSIFIGNGAILLVIATAWFFTAHERITPSYERARQQDRGLSAAGAVLRRREFYLLGFAVLGGATTFTTNLLFLPLYFVHERGFSLATAGSITAVIPLGGLLVNATAGFVSDRIGRRKPMIWPSGIALPVLWFLMLSPLPPAVLIPIAFLTGAFVFLPFPALQAIPLEIPGFSPAERAIGQAFQMTISTVGILLGPIIVSNIVHSTDSYRTGLLWLLLLPTLFIWVMPFLPETGPRARAAAAAKAAAGR
jgi:MFS family permease